MIYLTLSDTKWLLIQTASNTLRNNTDHVIPSKNSAPSLFLEFPQELSVSLWPGRGCKMRMGAKRALPFFGHTYYYSQHKLILHTNHLRLSVPQT